MHKLFGRFRHKNEKILQRELMFAHTCVALLSLALISVLSTVYGTVDDVNQTLVVIVNILLAIVTLISVSIVIYIKKYGK